jgi:uncharacterized protein (DUF2342 family)
MADDSTPSNPDPSEFGNNPFANLPMFGDLAKALAGQGPLNWDAARQFAGLASNSGGSEPNVDPAVRIALADLARIIEMHVRDLTALDTPFPEITPVTKGVWAQRTLEAYRPLFTELATSLGRRPGTDLDTEEAADPMMAMMANLSQMMAPAMMGMAVGSMVGRMAGRTFGQYDLPIPRSDNALLVVPATIDQFANEWSLPVDEMRLWVLAQEMIGHTLFTITPLRDQFTAMVRQHVGAFRPGSVRRGRQAVVARHERRRRPDGSHAASALRPSTPARRRPVPRTSRAGTAARCRGRRGGGFGRLPG